MNKKLLLSSLLGLLSFFTFGQQYDDICSPVGWATHDGSVTGGEGGDTVWVSTFNDLKTHAESADTEVIILTGSVGIGGGITSRIYLKSNKTLLGYGNAELHGSIFVSNANNIVIRNLKVRGDGAHDRDGEDCMAISNSTRVWIDHVEFEDGGDGNLDIVRESNYVTVSWCKFSYTSKSTYHQWSNLNGNSDSRITDRGKLKITFHHNYWAEGCIRRMPNVRFGQVHVVNNYYRTEQKDDFCIGATKEADMLIENNVFEWVNNPLMYTNEATAAQMRNNLFIATPGDKTGFGTAFTPPYPYTMTPKEDVESLVRSGVGRRDLNDLLCSGHVSADCNGTPDGTAYEDVCGTCVGGTTGLTACTEIIEAETACNADGDSNESSNSGFSGTGYVNTNNVVGASVTYMIHSDQDQQVELGYRFANGGTSARPGTISVNGQAGNTLPLPVTSSWSNWESAMMTIDLTKGLNKIEITATTAGGLANLDHFTIYDNSVTSAPCTDCNGDFLGTAIINDCGACSGGLTNVDPDEAPTWYADADNDGLGDPAVSQQSCGQPIGYVLNSDDSCPEDEKNVCHYQFDDLCTPVGWAVYNGTTNGGEGGDTVLVSTFTDLKSHAESVDAKVIILTGSVGTGGGAASRIYVNSNKTILGDEGAELHGYFIIDGVNNIVIRNLKVRGDGARDNGADDAISVISSTRLWFDHLDISDGEDGNLDIKRESNYITISWCKFSYTDASVAHKFSNLIGHSDDHTADRGHSKVTLHHNYWAAGVKQRMPRVRFGQVHIVNNYYRSDSDGNDYCIGAGKEADLLIENNVFELVTNPLNYIGEAATAVNLNNNLFTNAPGDKTETGTAFTPPYSYTMTPVADVEDLVKNNAGPRDLKGILCSDQINTDCNGDQFGTATLDECGVCSGGLTGVEASTKQTWYADTDNDGLGDPNSSVEDCNQPNGYVSNSDDECPNDDSNTCNDPVDCNGDRNGTATLDECGVCSGGLTGVQPSTKQTWYADTDNDGLGDPNNSVEDCNQPNGYVSNSDDECPNDDSNTCNDPVDCNGDINGTATLDACGVCSGGLTGVEASTKQTWYADTDNDGLGDPNNSVEDCNQPNGYVANANDECPNDDSNTCNDPVDCNGDINGTATLDACGICSGGLTGVTPSAPTTWFADTDNDGLGDPNNSVEDCNQPNGYVANANDECPNDDSNTCNDPVDCNGDINGTATIDDCGVCSGGLTGVTPSAPTTWYADTDNDGLGDPNNSVEDCNQPNGYVANANDECPNDDSNTCNDPVDCNGDVNGNATIDDCGVCSGGLTGVEPCTQDCNGDWGGTAAIDQCQVCSGGNTGIIVDKCSVSGLGSTTESNNIYPNPTTDFVHLSHKTTWTVTNVQGEILNTGEGDKIDLNTVAAGVYIISTPTNSYKIIKQ